MSRALIEQNLQLLAQARALLDALDDERFAGPRGDGGREAGVGPHLRHCIDFYRCFLRDLPRGRIDYDRRERELDLERRTEAARAAIAAIEAALGEVTPDDRRLDVRVDTAPDEDPETAWSGSSLSRELRFLVSHTVHHYALIAQRLRAGGFDPGASFGVAPSTLAFWSEQDAAG
ncbi:MAG: DinB family protein [Thermoanaerobaculia bacterium]|nr:DinB family protein [Thermoanaerobaculia bacterium]